MSKTYSMQFTDENHKRNKKGIKTNTRRVIEKIDQYKNMKPGDIIHITKNRFTKKDNYLYRLKCITTWTEYVKDITTEGIMKEGLKTNLRGHSAQVDLLEKWIELWDSINIFRGYGWMTNPKVRVISYKFIKGVNNVKNNKR